MSVPQATTNSGSSYRAVSQVGSPSQMGASGQFTSPGGNYYRGLFPQSQATSSQYALGYSKPISSLQSTSSQSTSVLSSRKQYSSASQGSSGSQFGASTDFASQGMSSSYSGSVLSPGTTGQFAPGSSPYASVSLSSPQGGPTTTVPGSRKQLTSTYIGSSGTQAGSSSFTLQGSTAYGGSRQSQGTASQFSPGSPSSYPGLSLSSRQGVASQSSSRKQLTSASQGGSRAQFGASTGFASEGMSSSYSGSVQSQGTTGQFAPGSPSSYPGLSQSSPQAGPFTTVQGSLKQFTSTYTGSSGIQTGSTPFNLRGSTAYGGSRQPQDTASRFAPTSPYESVYCKCVLSPQGVDRHSTTAQGSQKRFTSNYGKKKIVNL
ncbi:putative lysozyme-like protein [Sinocyclocheilus rhinocerous]|uniref:putative lysozyme-like protein n=1 Tax=Sinocyclocheilus rhinocerous TaxID=307959 RepID=UPI0007B84BA0|nr:PREDICTED: putative lysozyme-like protein [Sinocyclocheilus rhinocerous]